MQKQDVIPGFKIEVAGSNETATSRFWRKVEIPGEENNTCWLWTGAPTAGGYGKFRVGGGGSPTISAHIVSFRSFFGTEYLSGVHIHHECGTRLCVRPDHLKEMDQSEHMALHYRAARDRKECLYGHDLTNKDNVYRWKNQKHCKICKRNEARIRLGIPYENWKIHDVT